MLFVRKLRRHSLQTLLGCAPSKWTLKRLLVPDLDFKVSMSVPLDKDNEGSCHKVINIKKTVFKRTKKKIVNLNS